VHSWSRKGVGDVQTRAVQLHPCKASKGVAIALVNNEGHGIHSHRAVPT
jgi:hypothetical protein